MDMTKESCRAFVQALSSEAPTPGGGGAAALVGAIGTALGNMVGSLTVGKRRYAGVEEEIRALMARCDCLQQELLEQVQGDAEGFLPLVKAYSLPKDAPHREKILQEASVAACQAPLKIMALCAESLDCIALFAEKGSAMAVSDAGCGAVCCKAAMEAASLNVFINTKTMVDRSLAEAINRQAWALLDRYRALADEIFASVMGRVGQ